MSFKILRSRKVASARVFNMMEETWQTPDKKRFVRKTIVHPGAVGILPMIRKNRILMVRQYRYAVREALLEIPAGTLEAGERPLACARREIKEEVGYAARRWKRLGTVFTAPGFCSEKITLYHAWDLTPANAGQDEDEYIEVVEMQKGEVKRAVRSGKIRDAKTLSALLLLEWL